MCANDGTATEAYCSYFVGSKACARCTNPIAAPPKAPADTKHFVTMTVSLPYTKDEFDTAKQDKYKAAVASSAGTRPANVVIISIKPTFSPSLRSAAAREASRSRPRWEQN